MDNSVKKLIVNMNLQTGEYVFDDGNQIKRVPIVNCEDVIYDTEEEIMEVYSFSEDLVEQVDCLLYNGLQDYDEQNESDYTIKYLGMIAKDIKRNPGESKNQYKKRIVQTRKEILEEIGLELNYDVAIIGASEKLSLSEKIFMKKVAQNQQENGANVNIHIAYKNPKKTLEKEEEKTSGEVLEGTGNNLIIDDFSNDGWNYSFDESVNNKSNKTEKEKVESTVDSSYGIKIKSKKDKFKKPDTKTTLEKKREVIGENDIPDGDYIGKTESDTEKREKQQYEIRVDTSYVTRSSETDRIDETEKKVEPYNIKTIKKDRSKFKKPDTEELSEEKEEKKIINIKLKGEESKPKKEEELKFNEIKDGKMLGVDEDRQSAIVETFVTDQFTIKNSESEEAKIIDFRTRKPKIEEPKISEIPIDKPKRERRAQRFIRKFKDVKDKIQNKTFVSKPRFINKKLLITGAIGIVAAISAIGIGIGAKAIISNIKANIQYTTENENESLGNKEQESEDKYIISAQGLKNEANAEQTSRINMGQTSQADQQQIVDTQKTKKTDDTDRKNSTYKKAEKTNSSTEYLKSVRVGTRMSINKGSYFETPEGTGKVGYFRNHKGKVKIISKIGIATKDGYTSISTSDVSLLELKEKYPDAEFSYHIVDEKGNIFGWMTSKSFEQHISKDQPQMDEGR